MLKKTFLLFLLPFCCGGAFAQPYLTKFVEGKNIQWAAYITDTAHFSGPNISLLLRNRYDKDEIKAFEPFYIGLDKTGLKRSGVRYIKKDSLFSYSIYRSIGFPFYDENGNSVPSPPEKRPELFSSTWYNAQTNDMIEYEQALYVESGKLKNVVFLVSPKFSVVTPGGAYLGLSNIFSTALNENKTISKKTKRKAISLGSTETKYTLQDSGMSMLKQMYGQHLLNVLWSHLGEKYYQVIRLDSMTTVAITHLNSSVLGDPSLYLPVYDEEGKVMNKLIGGRPIDPSMFSSFSINRVWYYSKEKNIFICDIPFITLYYSKKDNDTGTVTETAVLKINMQ